MKRYKNGIEVAVKPHSSSMRYYVILYRPKRRFNLFNYWRTLVEVWDGAYLTYDQPLLYSDFDCAVNYAQKIKDNPELINEHYIKQNKIYNDALKRRNDYYNNRNKSINL